MFGYPSNFVSKIARGLPTQPRPDLVRPPSPQPRLEDRGQFGAAGLKSALKGAAAKLATAGTKKAYGKL